ncbi:MAG: hypothetical protein QM831_10625 [Kofleriaceae bacterium]
MRLVVGCIALAACGRLDFATVAVDASADSPDAFVDPSLLAQVVAGGQSTYARNGNGVMWAWGDGGDGGVGDGSGLDRPSPVRIGISDARSIEANDGGALVITASGELVGWGPNTGRQLGDASSSPQLSPITVPSAPIMSATMGNQQLCVLYTDRTVGCAGIARYLGDGGVTDRSTLGPVPGVTHVIQLIASDDFTCARLLDGSVTCWGDNTYGQLGGSFPSFSFEPTLTAAGPYVEITVGDAHVCGRRDTGAVECWGRNTNGEYGDGTTNGGSTPTASTVTDAIALAGFAAGTCAIRADRTVACWGGNDNDELALDHNATTFLPTPVKIPGLENIVAISSRTDLHICAIDANAQLYCWGDDLNGQVGDNNPGGAQTTPTRITLP